MYGNVEVDDELLRAALERSRSRSRSKLGGSTKLASLPQKPHGQPPRQPLETANGCARAHLEWIVDGRKLFL